MVTLLYSFRYNSCDKYLMIVSKCWRSSWPNVKGMSKECQKNIKRNQMMKRKNKHVCNGLQMEMDTCQYWYVFVTSITVEYRPSMVYNIPTLFLLPQPNISEWLFCYYQFPRHWLCWSLMSTTEGPSVSQCQQWYSWWCWTGWRGC